MADLIDILPNFDLSPWRHLTYSLEKKGVLTAELISLDPIEISRRCPLPLKEVRRMAAAVTEALKIDLGYRHVPQPPQPQTGDLEPVMKRARIGAKELNQEEVRYVKTLDPRIDECLGGGFPAGSICEIVGESAVGKTQFVISLLLTAQLPPPLGLGKSTLYVATESALTTKRLLQMLRSHPRYAELPPEERPTTDKVYSIDTHTLEAQDHTTTFKLPEAVRRYDIGLIVIDSVAANFRVEFQGASRKVLGERAVALVKLGRTLRKIAHEKRVTIVCTNQVADRFDDDRTRTDKIWLSSSQSQVLSQPAQKQAGGRAAPAQQSADSAAKMQPPIIQTQRQRPLDTQMPDQSLPFVHHKLKHEIMSLDFQQRFFTGWGDNEHNARFEYLKTPALGLTWANQIDARIVLKISNSLNRSAVGENQSGDEGYLWSSVKRRRHLKVVFAPWAAPSTNDGVEYTLEMQGPVSIEPIERKKCNEDGDFDVAHHDDVKKGQEDTEHAELLDPKYWEGIEDEEFP